MTHNETRISNARLGSIITGLKTRLSAGASGAPDMDRDLISALAELQELRANPSPSDGEVSEAEVDIAEVANNFVWQHWPEPITSENVGEVRKAAIRAALQSSKRGQP